MNKKSYIVLLLFFISFFSNYSIAQNTPGGEAGDHESLQPSPISFKRNNGNGTCTGVAEIRVTFQTLPTYLPTIAQVRSEQRDVEGIVVGKIDTTEFTEKGYVSYCISSANIIPATKLWIRFYYEKSKQDFWLSENERYNKAISQH